VYTTDASWCITETHLDVQVDPANFFMTKSGNPKLGHFTFGASIPCEYSWTQDVDLTGIEGWEPGSTLYITAYASVTGNSQEGAWGEGTSFPGNNWAMYFECEAPWICGMPFVDERDERSYNTVQIGDQCWMAENLNVGSMILANTHTSNNGVIEKYCYDNNGDNCEIFGGLYQWYELMQWTAVPGSQGICPEGWHVPTDYEWCILENKVDAGTISYSSFGWRGVDAGKNLKSSGGWYMSGNGTDAFGFATFPGGRKGLGNDFHEFNQHASFWSSTRKDYRHAWGRDLKYDHDDIHKGLPNTYDGHAVRCIRH
jgi:uncharacterized protein (TIGR02145 family)